MLLTLLKSNQWKSILCVFLLFFLHSKSDLYFKCIQTRNCENEIVIFEKNVIIYAWMSRTLMFSSYMTNLNYYCCHLKSKIIQITQLWETMWHSKCFAFYAWNSFIESYLRLVQKWKNIFGNFWVEKSKIKWWLSDLRINMYICSF